jgi:hypothetical protein
MSTLSSVLVGVGTAILAVVAWILASVSVEVGAGAGAVTVALDSGWVTVAAMVGFIAGFTLHRRRAKRRLR